MSKTTQQSQLSLSRLGATTSGLAIKQQTVVLIICPHEQTNVLYSTTKANRTKKSQHVPKNLEEMGYKGCSSAWNTPRKGTPLEIRTIE